MKLILPAATFWSQNLAFIYQYFSCMEWNNIVVRHVALFTLQSIYIEQLEWVYS